MTSHQVITKYHDSKYWTISIPAVFCLSQFMFNTIPSKICPYLCLQTFSFVNNFYSPANQPLRCLPYWSNRFHVMPSWVGWSHTKIMIDQDRGYFNFKYVRSQWAMYFQTNGIQQHSFEPVNRYDFDSKLTFTNDFPVWYSIYPPQLGYKR